MSIPLRLRGVRVLKAVSSLLRLQILNLLFDRGPLSYTELMSLLKLSPTRDAGRFAYHLRFLLKADLVEADVETKKYGLTELGKTVIEVADKIEKKAIRPRSMLVRTSRFALEEFDANKIANSLIKETKMPVELAQKVAKEAERRLLRSKTKYLTAPLVREVVNAILIEKGLEEYRHKLTRLGLPIYDVTALISQKDKNLEGASSIQEAAGDTVLKEYVLLNTFPRDIADAHLSGSINVRNLSTWILKPSDIVHDARCFFKNLSPSSPESLEYALNIVLNVLLRSVKEVSGTQTIEYFNVFLAPFIRGKNLSHVKEAMRLFISTISQNVDASLTVELAMPNYLLDKRIAGSHESNSGKYGDFIEESQALASLLLEIMVEESELKPMFNPKIIVRIRPETLTNQKAKETLLKAFELASNKGVPYFVNSLTKDQKSSVFLPSGLELKADVNGDWETDTLRVGGLGCVTLNMPRMAYESSRDKMKFFEIFKDRLDMAHRALQIKYKALKQHGYGLLPTLMQNINGEHYLRLETCQGVVNLVGLREAIESFYGKNLKECEMKTEFIEEMRKTIQASTRKVGKRHLVIGMLPDFEASERLAQLDIERYGIAKVRCSGTRDKPFYASTSKLTFENNKILEENLLFEKNLHETLENGTLTVIELDNMAHDPQELLLLTKQIFENYNIKFLTYSRKTTYCVSCKKTWFGLLRKCPSCSSIGTLRFFDRFPY